MGRLIQLSCTLETLIHWLAPGTPVNAQYVHPRHAFDGGV